MSIDRKFKLYGPPTVLAKGKAEHPLQRDQVSLIVASTGSGKTQLLLNIAEAWSEDAHKGKYDKIFLYTGSPGDAAIKTLDPKHVDVFGPQTQQSFVDTLLAFESDKRSEEKLTGKKPLPSLLILDDAAGDRELMSPNLKGSIVGNLIISHRHLRLSIIITSQKFSYIPTLARANASLFFIFPTKSGPEMKTMAKDLPFSEDVLVKAMQAASATPHQFVYLSVPEKKVFLGFDDCICE